MTELEAKLQYQFKSDNLLEVALTHKSFHFEPGNSSLAHNEKLEFLGDAVLDLVLSQWLMEQFPNAEEGSLSKKRASLVNETVLCEVAKELSLPEFIKLGKGERLSNGFAKPRLLASVYEAVVGAIFVDAGYDKAKDIIRLHFQLVKDRFDVSEDFAGDFKTRLQELVQGQKKPAPVYHHLHEEGPAHERIFFVRVLVGDQILAEASGKSKKIAEQNAAQIALQRLTSEKSEVGS